MTNIFDIIGKVTCRIEPFHSELLTVILRDNKVFFKSFITHIFRFSKNDASISFIESDSIKVLSEDSFFDYKRIDIIIKEPNTKNIIGIEVKTSDSSVRNNQLMEYYDKMVEKYPDYRVFLVFLTPFNTKNLPKEIVPRQIAAINEFTIFQNLYPNSIHVNWDEVVNFYKADSEFDTSILKIHYSYIKSKITNQSRLITRISNVERNRGLAIFFGDECLDSFYEYITNNEIVFSERENELYFEISKNGNNHSELFNALKILIESDKLNKKAIKQNKISDELKQRYENGTNGDFFKQLFEFINGYPYLWMEGQRKIGVRVSHSLHPSSGVSIVTLNNDSLIIRKKR